MYGNEFEVGEAVRQSGIPRSEIFVITKLCPDQYGHAGKAIEEAIRDSKVRSAGISCYYIKETDRFLPQVTIKPALIKNEIHPYYQDSKVIQHIQNLDIALQGWYPLGGRGYNHALLHGKVLREIAKTHGKSSICLASS